MSTRMGSLALVIACACARQNVRPSGPAVSAQPAAESERSAAPRPAPAPTPSELRARARTALSTSDFAAAAAALEQYLRIEPRDPAALFEAGWVAERRGDGEGARRKYAVALESDPGHAAAALNLARLMRIAGQPADAAEICAAALRKNTDDPRLLDALAASLREQKKLDEA